MLHILLVEDNPGDVLMVREAIRTRRLLVDVVVAHDGEEALKVVNDYKFEPDVVILDMNLPRMNGLKFLERFRRREFTPVIVFTSSANPNDNKRALELGAREYIIKPLDLIDYTNTVADALERWTEGADTRAI